MRNDLILKYCFLRNDFCYSFLRLSPSKEDEFVRSGQSGRHSKKRQMQGARPIAKKGVARAPCTVHRKPCTFVLLYAAVTKDEAQHRRWTFYEAVKEAEPMNSK
jgi:hypothetical protein